MHLLFANDASVKLSGVLKARRASLSPLLMLEVIWFHALPSLSPSLTVRSADRNFREFVAPLPESFSVYPSGDPTDVTVEKKRVSFRRQKSSLSPTVEHPLFQVVVDDDVVVVVEMELFRARFWAGK